MSLANIIELPDVSVRHDERAESSVVKMIRRVRPDWPKREVILQRLRPLEAASSDPAVRIYGGYTENKGEMIVIKVYSSEAINKAKEILGLRHLAAHHLGSRIFATFANGLILEQAPGIPLNYDLSIDRKIYPLVARHVGTLHRRMKEELTLAKLQASKGQHGENVFKTLRPIIKQLSGTSTDYRRQNRIRLELPSKASLENELTELETHLSSEPTLFCHGALAPQNIYYDPTSQTITFVNLEFAGFNFQAFELAQVFLSFVGSDMERAGREEFVPAKEFQIRWLHSYLAAFRDVTMDKVTRPEIENLYRTVRKFNLVFCLHEIVWAMTRMDQGRN